MGEWIRGDRALKLEPYFDPNSSKSTGGEGTGASSGGRQKDHDHDAHGTTRDVCLVSRADAWTVEGVDKNVQAEK